MRFEDDISEWQKRVDKSIESLKFNKVIDWTDSIPKGDKPKSPDMQADNSEESGNS